MSDFRGSTAQTSQVSASAGDPIPVLMPADVQAGDYLFVIGGNQDLNVIGFTTTIIGGQSRSFGTGGATDWELLAQNPYIFVKEADGSEGGTVVNFATQDTTSSGIGPWSCVMVALCYRWSVTPTPNVLPGFSLGPHLDIIVSNTRSFSGASPVDSASGGAGGAYPGLAVGVETRIIALIGAGTEPDYLLQSDPLGSATWYGDNIADRTGLHSEPYDGSIDPLVDLAPSTSVSVADALYVGRPFAATTVSSGAIITGGTNATGALHAITLKFPALPLVAYWGVLVERM